MSFQSSLKCTRCGEEYEPQAHITTCTECDGVLHALYDLDSMRDILSPRKLERRGPGVWRYSELLPIREQKNMVSLGEGGTYLHKCDRLAKETGLRNLYLKDETTNPTGAFIDRGTAVEISAAKERGLRSVCCGSSGNLAASFVAYAARAGLNSKVFIGQRGTVDVGKFYQILAYAADVEIVKNHEEALARAQREGRRNHCVMGHNPHFLEGEKTTVYETCEQLEWAAPDCIVVPMGNGGHISMIWKGLTELEQVGLISQSTARLVGAQADGCSPIVDAFQRGDRNIIPAKMGSTVAFDIGVKSPSSGHNALNAIEMSKGTAQAVSDREILEAVRFLAKLEGVFAEPSSATTIAVLKKLVESGSVDRSDIVVCMITGMGLKYPEIARTFVKGRGELEHLLSRVEGRKFTTKLGETKVYILRILSKAESYGYGIWKALKNDFGIALKIPSVYQHLTELTGSGLVIRTRTEQTHEKRQRNYYALTEEGKWTLTQLEKLER
ncbi:MAG: threonine synthase [Candidatus Thorarchaeota archaeon]